MVLVRIRIASLICTAALLTTAACSAITESDEDNSSYFFQATVPSGSSSVRSSTGQSFPNLSGAFVTPTATYVSAARDGDCWMSINLTSTTGAATLITTGGSTGEAPSIYYQCASDAYPDAPLSGTATLVSRSVDPRSGAAAFTIDLSGAFARPASGSGPNLTFTGTLSASFTDASGVPGAPAGALSLSCPGSLPGGYHCLSMNGAQAPGRYDLPVLHGTWVELVAQVCMTLNSNGTSGFRYKSGFGPTTGLWGALVNKSGQFQPTSGPFYVLTGSTDSQIKLLSFDESGARFVGWDFRRGSCPW